MANVAEIQDGANIKSSIENQAAIVEKYRHFSSATMQRQLSARLIDNAPIQVYSETVYASVLLADISGFTRLSARLSAEELKQHINEYFTMLLTVVRENSGDVIKFLGDAVLIIWPIAIDAREEDKAAANLMACLCALKLLKDCGEYDRGEGTQAVSLRLHCGISSGNIHCLCMGVDKRWEYIVSGDPLKQMGVAESEAEAGEVCVAESVHSFIKEKLESTVTSNGSHKLSGKLCKSFFESLKSDSSLHPRLASHLREAELQLMSEAAMRSVTSSTATTAASESADKASHGSYLSSFWLMQRMFRHTSNKVSDDSPPPSQTLSQPSHSSPGKGLPLALILLERVEEDDVGCILDSDLHVRAVRSYLDGYLTPIQLDLHQPIIRRMGSHSSSKEHLMSPHAHNHNTGGAIKRESSGQLTIGRTTSLAGLPQMSAIIRHTSSVNIQYKENNGFIARHTSGAVVARTGHSARDSSGGYSGTGAEVAVRRQARNNRTTDVFKSDSPVAAVLKFFAHDAARVAIENGTSAYLAELRSVVTLFVEILSLEDELLSGLVERPQEVLSCVLASCERFGGSLRQYVVDDKGTVVIVAFGLPGSSHEDNCTRAVETAIAIRMQLQGVEVDCREGIAEGNVYCGLVGAADRCEYAMMGCSVNLAARLMGKCAPGQILVNETVYLEAQAVFVFEELPRVVAKGYANPVAVFCPIERRQGAVLDSESSKETSSDFYGRSDELKHLVSLLKCLAVSKSGYAGSTSVSEMESVVVEGAAGIGKSRLVAEAIHQATTMNLPIKSVTARASASHTESAYQVVRQLMEHMIGLKLGNNLNAQGAILMSPSTSRIKDQFSTNAGAPRRGNGSVTAPAVDSSNVDVSVCLTIESWLREHAGTDVVALEDAIPRINEAYLNRQVTVEPLDEVMSPFTASEIRRIGSIPKTQKTSFGGIVRLIDQADSHSVQASLVDLVPLLGPVLGTTFNDNAVTSPLRISLRKTLLEAYLVKILHVGVTSGLFNFILVENLQWIDTSSLRVLIRLLNILKSGLVICTSRPAVDHSVASITAPKALYRQRLLSVLFDQFKQTFDLKPLSVVDVRHIIERHIGPALLSMHPNILSTLNVSQLFQRAGSSPFHAVLLSQGLQRALVTGTFTSIQDLPSGAHAIIMARLDQFSNLDQVILKTAAVIGNTFARSELRYALAKMVSADIAQNLGPSLQKLLESKFIVLQETLPEDDVLYAFNDVSVQESIYHLMLATQREQVHGYVGDFLEYKASNNSRMFQSRFSDIVHHYTSSNIIYKKVQYLQHAAIVSKRTKAYADVYRYYSQLLKLATGVEIDELIRVCCRRSTTESKLLNMKSVPEKSPPEHAVHHLPSVWISYHDIVKKIPIANASASSAGNGGHSGITNMHLNYELVCSWLGDMSLAQATLGHLPQANNLLSLALYSFGFNISKPASLIQQKMNAFLKFAYLGSLDSLPRVTSQFILRLQLSQLQSLALLYLTRGMPYRAGEALDMAVRLLARYKDTVTCTGASTDDDFEFLTGNNVYMTEPKDWEAECQRIVSRLNMLLIWTLIVHPYGGAQSRIASLRQHCSMQGGDDAFVLISRAVQSSVDANFDTASDFLDLAATIALRSQDKQMHLIALVMRGWLALISGKMSDATQAVQRVLSNPACGGNSCVHVWALELEIFLQTCGLDFENAKANWHLILTLQNCEEPRLTATSSAVVANALVAEDLHSDALEYAKHACLRLSARKHTHVTVAVILYIAASAAMDSVERLRERAARQPAAGKELSVKSRRRGPNDLEALGKDCGTAQSTSGAFRLLEKTEIGASVGAALNALQVTSERFNCIILLHVALQARVCRFFGSRLCIGMLNEIDSRLSPVKELYSEFTFGWAHLHLQRALLCKHLNSAYSFLSIGSSINIARGCFRKLGYAAMELVNLYNEEAAQFTNRDSDAESTPNPSTRSIAPKKSFSGVRKFSFGEMDKGTPRGTPTGKCAAVLDEN